VKILWVPHRFSEVFYGYVAVGAVGVASKALSGYSEVLWGVIKL